jgi:hypothetical protein
LPFLLTSAEKRDQFATLPIRQSADRLGVGRPYGAKHGGRLDRADSWDRLEQLPTFIVFNWGVGASRVSMALTLPSAKSRLREAL